MADEIQTADATCDPLVKLCSLLNQHSVRYLVVGGHACILHGLVRTTEDIDILIEEDEGNYRRVIAALSQLRDGAAAELTVDDLRDNVVVKVADEIEVDISRRAWKVSYADAIKNSLNVEIDKISVPYLGLKDLIASKETYREEDRSDLIRLRMILHDKPSGA